MIGRRRLARVVLALPLARLVPPPALPTADGAASLPIVMTTPAGIRIAEFANGIRLAVLDVITRERLYATRLDELRGQLG